MAAESLVQVAEGVWTAADPVRIAGTSLTKSMTVARLNDDQLLVYSPVALTPERREAVEGLGTVAHVYAPNTFHHVHAVEWKAAFPAAKLHAAQGLRKKRRDLAIDRSVEAGPEPGFAGVLDELHIDGFRLDESVLVHRPSRVLMVADLVHNIGRPEGAWTRFYTKTMGFYDRIALSGALRATAFSDRAAARRSIDQLLNLPFDSVVVGHGAPILSGAKDALRAAYGFLG